MRKNRLLIVLFTGVAVLLSLASCTYDYFEDETNYQVFVPEVLNKTVSDCRVLVYNDAGTLVGARYATSPWDKDPRMEAGLFSFRLLPANIKYTVIPIRTVLRLWTGNIWMLLLLF